MPNLSFSPHKVQQTVYDFNKVSKSQSQSLWSWGSRSFQSPMGEGFSDVVRFSSLPDGTVKIIRDPIHGRLALNLRDETDALLWQLINTPEFQRLGRIHQRGLTEPAFPGDTHTRQAHSIGTLIVARKVWNHLEQTALQAKLDLPKNLKAAFLAAALLHDIGHGPFSHTFDIAVKQNHEDRTLEIITSPKTEIYKALKMFEKEHLTGAGSFPTLIKQLLTSEGLPEGLKPFSTLLSGIVDVDKLDYTLRCSTFSGFCTKAELYDVDKLVENLGIDFQTNRLYIQQAGVPVLKKLFTAIFNIYKNRVFLPPNHFAHSEMLKAFLTRYKSLVKEERNVVPYLLPVIKNAFSHEKIPLSQYLVLDDSVMTAFLRSAGQYAKDPLLKELANKILNSTFYTAVSFNPNTSRDKLEIFKIALDALIQENQQKLKGTVPNPQLQWAVHAEERPFLNANKAQQFWIKTKAGDLKTLVEVLGRYPKSTSKLQSLRCYFHPALENIVKQAIQVAHLEVETSELQRL